MKEQNTTRTFIAALCLSASVSTWGATAEQSLISRGEYLARAGDCIACHTAKDGKAFTGGLPLGTPIGTIYSTNITPDPETGIGKYSFEAFDDAVRRGIRSDGATLYPAMPYPSYATVTNDDMHALYAYFMKGVVAVDQPNKDSEIPWPLSMRFPLAGWRWLFAPAPNTATVPHPSDPVITRGAYLVEGLGHCGSCHTPRALSLQERALSDANDALFLSGGAPIEGWVPKDLRGSPVTGLGRWSEQDIVQFLQTGRNDHTAAFGGMREVVGHSMQYMSDADLSAIARYLKTLAPSNANEVAAVPDDGSTARKLHDLQLDSLGARVYADNCMACHRSTGNGYPQTFPELAHNSVLNDPAAASIIQIILTGNTVQPTKAAPTAYSMPAFGWRLDDDEVAAVATFIRQSWGNTGTPVSALDVAEVRRTVPVQDQQAQGMPVHTGAIEARFDQ
jgi:mono/diheme cytochrome c family protein